MKKTVDITCKPTMHDFSALDVTPTVSGTQLQYGGLPMRQYIMFCRKCGTVKPLKVG